MAFSPFEMGVLRSKMTEGSAAMVLGRSAAWVVRQRAALAEDTEWAEGAPAGVVSEAESQPHPQPSAPAAGVPEYEVAAAGPTVVVQVAVEPLGQVDQFPAPAPKLVHLPADPPPAPRIELEQKIVRRPPPVPAPAPMSLFSPSNEAVKIDMPEIPPRIVRWAGWFIDARWSIATVAGLFEVPEPALRSALDLARKAGQAA